MIRRARGDDLENQLNRSALWAVTYGDLMSYLMIFFLILFTFSLSKSGKAERTRRYQQSLVSIQKVFGGKGSSPDFERLARREREETMVEQLKETMDRQNLSEFAQIEMWDKKVRLVLAEAVLFDSGSADLKPGARRLLEAVAEQIRPLPNPVVIEGHTDDVPVGGRRWGSNWELSMSRAYAVVSFLEGNGVPPGRLAGIGYGEHRPIAENATAEGRAKNRRIEIDLIREE